MKQNNNLIPLRPSGYVRDTAIYSGFTLIELLVVVSIIVILSAIGIANYRTVAEKGRDTRRQADLEQIRGALELYKADDASSAYPASATLSTCGGPLQAGVAPNIRTYMTKIPCDPGGDGTTPYSYSCSSPYATYYLGADLELTPSSSPFNCTTAFGAGTTNDYCITNP
jgi:prepilin-type N-terminal cleavage/methylation domain-containing protein